jgi:hypothetical protein
MEQYVTEFWVTKNDLEQVSNVSDYITDTATRIATEQNFQLKTIKVSENGNEFFYPNMVIELWGIKNEATP